MIPTIVEIPLPFTIFGLSAIPIHSFGLSMVLAFIGAWRLLVLQIRALGEDEEIAEQMITWAAIGGLLGARLLYLLSFPKNLMEDPLAAIFGGAGFVFYGGFIGGAAAVILLLYRKKKPIAVYADLAAPAMALGYAIGRVGCQLSGDGDYGMASDVPWAMGYPLGVVPTGAGVTVHPAPVYETIMALLLCFILCSKWLKNWQSRPGQIFGVYLLGAAVARFLVEAVRIEPVIAFSLTQAQLTAVLMAMIGVVLMRSKRQEATL